MIVDNTINNTLQIFVVGPLEENCYLLFDNDTHQAVVIDPGGEDEQIRKFLSKHRLSLNTIIITHSHWDHISAVIPLYLMSKARILVHTDDASSFFSFAAHQQGSVMSDIRTHTILGEDNQTVAINRVSYTIIATPGHTPGGICLYGEGKLFSGDTLFQEGIGRSDMPGGDGMLLTRMIKEKLFVLPDAVVVYPGHGPSTTIGWEKKHNPFDLS